MKTEFVLNGDTRIALVPETPKDKSLNRLAFDGNIVLTVDLRDDGALVFKLAPKGEK